MPQDVGQQFARQVGQGIQAGFVQWGHVVEQGFEVAAHMPGVARGQQLVQHDGGARIAARQQAQGGQPLWLRLQLVLHLRL